MGPFRPSMMDGPHNIPSFATFSLLTWSIALARKIEDLQVFNTNYSTIEFVGVDHGGFCIAMTKQLLDRTDIVASLQ